MLRKLILFITSYVLWLPLFAAMPATDIGHHGLTNVGSSCFMNACLQAFFHTMPLTNEISTRDPDLFKGGCPWFSEYIKLAKFLNSGGDDAKNPQSFYDVFLAQFGNSTGFVRGWHNDAHEFTTLFIQNMPYQFSEKICFNRRLKKTCSTIMGHVTVNEPEQASMFYLELPLAEGLLTKEFAQFSPGAIKCETVGCLSDAYQQYVLEKTDQCLIVAFKRFLAITEKTFTKNRCATPFPFNLLLKKEYFWPSNASSVAYQLDAVVIHSGDLGGGHYYAYARDMKGSRDWWLYDDSSATKVGLATVNKIATTGLDGGSTPYLLFYEKTDLGPLKDIVEKFQESAYGKEPENGEAKTLRFGGGITNENLGLLFRECGRPVDDYPEWLSPEEKTLLSGIKKDKIEEFDLTGCSLQELPDNIKELSGLKRLVLAENRFAKIPAIVSGLAGLEVLNLSKNPLTKDAFAGSLPVTLKVLDVSDCENVAVWPTAEMVPVLTTFRAVGTKITDIPEWIAARPTLVEVNLPALEPASLPEAVKKKIRETSSFMVELGEKKIQATDVPPPLPPINMEVFTKLRECLMDLFYVPVTVKVWTTGEVSDIDVASAITPTVLRHPVPRVSKVDDHWEAKAFITVRQNRDRPSIVKAIGTSLTGKLDTAKGDAAVVVE